MISRAQRDAAASDSVANESIVVVVDGRRRNLSNLSSRKINLESSLYPTVEDLPTIETTDQIWASFRREKKKVSIEEKWSAAFSSSNPTAGDVDDASGAKESEQEDSEQANNSKARDHDADKSPSRTNDDSEQFANRKMVEVTPGHFVPLRGAEETLQALDNGKVANTTCISCDTALVVHEGASMIICPDCEMIAPLLEKEEASLGLGLRLDTLKLSEQALITGKSAVGRLKRDPDEEESTASF